MAYESTGRTTQLNGWAYEYDAQGRLIRACQASSCTGSPTKVEFAYDGAGHRTQIKEFTSGALNRTRDIRYQGDAIVEEKVTDSAHQSGAVVRNYIVDDAGSIVKLTIPAGETGAGTYLVTWNGHGDALALWLINGDGTLTLANSYTYSTWGTPTTSTHNGIPDLGFRFLYVGKHDVQWDNAYGLGLAYMHARHYSPLIGRFLQPDPDASEANLYAYAANSPVTEMDPDGTCFIILCIAAAVAVSALIDTAIYTATTDRSQWSVQGAAQNAAIGAVMAPLGVVGKVARYGGTAMRAVGGLAGRALYGSNTARVFWTGGPLARSAATAWARENGAVTIGMTRFGRALEKADKYLPGFLVHPWWKVASAGFALGATASLRRTDSGSSASSASWRSPCSVWL